MSHSSELGTLREIDLPQGTLRYRERGEGPPLVFVHGLLVNGDLWRKVVPRLSGRFRCITPDLPLGSHELPMKPGADLSPPGLAALLVEFCRALGLERPTAIANDTGGALTQIAMTEHPGAFGRVVLTSCDCFDNFLPPMFLPLQWLARVPPLLSAVLQPMRWRPVRRIPLAFGWLAKRPDLAMEDGYVAPFFAQREIRRDAIAVLRGISPRYTRRAAERMGEFDGPLLVAWAADDRFFPLEHGQRLANLAADGRFVAIEDSYTFIMEDQPEALVKHLEDFLQATQG